MEVFQKNNSTKIGFISTFEEQNIIISYLNYLNPYRSLILFYDVGMGKTYAAACLSQIYLAEGFKVLYISNTLNSINNFKSEYNKVISDSRLVDFSKNLELMSFSKFYKHSSKEDYGLIILDEVHNLRESAIRYKDIKKYLDSSINSKLLIITATPMIDSTKELNSIIKLTNESEPLILFPKNKRDFNVKINYIGEKINNEILYLSKMKGIQLKNYIDSLNSNINDVFTKTRQASISSSENYDINIPLEEQSSKIYKLVNTLDYNKLTVVFCFYVRRGINFLAQVLESIGYKRWPNKGRTYAIIDGNNTNKETEDILRAFNSIINENGKLIHLLIGSSVLSESITLYRVKELHILSPFWNYGQIQQSIGRTIRYGSHDGLVDKSINIYLHAAYINNKKGKDIDMWKISNEKKLSIENKIIEEKSKIYEIKEKKLDLPLVDNILVFKVDNFIWDLSECFEKHKYKISWCKINKSKAIGYNLENNTKIYGYLDPKIVIHQPVEGCIWRSCIDGNLRYNKTAKRGKLIHNMNTDELNKVALANNCPNNIDSIINSLKSKNKYFDKQIEIIENDL